MWCQPSLNYVQHKVHGPVCRKYVQELYGRYADADFEAEKFLLPWLSKSSLNLFVQA